MNGTPDDEVVCPQCKGRGMIRPPGEWSNETCPLCEGRGRVAAAAADAWTRMQDNS
jgi:DnaJ-class molecular chaperone